MWFSISIFCLVWDLNDFFLLRSALPNSVITIFTAVAQSRSYDAFYKSLMVALGRGWVGVGWGCERFTVLHPISHVLEPVNIYLFRHDTTIRDGYFSIFIYDGFVIYEYRKFLSSNAVQLSSSVFPFAFPWVHQCVIFKCI